VKRYTLSFAASINHPHEHPERTAYHPGGGLDFDNHFQVWPNRASMARSVRMQQKRERHSDDWVPVVKLSDGEGY
jgi:hypothetical protein